MNPDQMPIDRCDEGRLGTDDIEELKIKINTLIWMYAPSSLTLEMAELRACDVLDKITKGA